MAEKALVHCCSFLPCTITTLIIVMIGSQASGDEGDPLITGTAAIVVFSVTFVLDCCIGVARLNGGGGAAIGG